jgi:carboxyl-terminal processing protease
MKQFKGIILLLVISVALFGQTKKENRRKNSNQVEFSNNQDTQAYLDMFEESFNKLNAAYVDSVNESEIIKEGIKGMMKKLDPYTRFVSGSSKDRLDMLRTGKYGGVGIQIGLRRDTLTVLAPMEDSPAYSEGIHAGDQIISIDSTSTEKMTLKEASSLIKGELGSTVTLHIFRPSTFERISFELTRSNITVKHVPYWGVDEHGIGYIRVTKFSKNTAKDFNKALNDLKRQEMKGLVIDLRGNSGGLLSNAISILDNLTDRGSPLLSTKGKIDRANKSYNSRRRMSVSPDLPIAVLINKSSASASEIVAGVLQDLDRAVVIGQKSFGKGLVQSMFNLNDTTTLKVTTAKYYTPSGRLIQKEDYLNNGFLTDGLDKHDSLFVTRGGRTVKGGGGITPDFTTDPNKFPPYIQGLWKDGVFLTFAATYAPVHNIQAPIVVTDKMLKDFKIFLNDFEIDYSLPGERALESMKKQMSKDSTLVTKKFNPIEFLMFWSKKKTKMEKLTKRLDRFFAKERASQFDLPENVKWIVNGLEREFSRVVSGEQERIKVSLHLDSEYSKAVEILTNLNRYYDVFEPATESAILLEEEPSE